MGKLTWKHLVVINVVIVLLIVGGYYLYMSVGASYTYKKHVAKGQTFLREENWKAAVAEFAAAAKIRTES